MDVTLQPDVERMVLEQLRVGAYSTASELLNAAVRSFLANGSANQTPGKLSRKSLELAQDAPANLDWLRTNGPAYQGQWVAIHKGTLIAHGANGLEVFRSAQAQGIDPPLMYRITPENPAFWGGW